ncbi:MAG: helix-turn-helix transcriptional regulator [Christensenellales bacterium]
MNNELGERIRELRKQRGMTQAQLAEKLEMSRQALSNWEKGSCEPDYLGILGLCKALNVDANRLLGVGEIFEQDKAVILTPTNQGKDNQDDNLVEVGLQDDFDTKNLPKKRVKKSLILLVVLVLAAVVAVGVVASLPFFNPLNSNVAYSVSFNLTTADKMKAVAIACAAVAVVACVWLVETAIENKKRKQEEKSNDRQI